MKLRTLIILLLSAGLLSSWILRQADQPSRHGFALSEEIQAPASDPASLAYALQKVTAQAEPVRDENQYERSRPSSENPPVEEQSVRQREQYRVVREGVEQKEGRGRAVAILEAPERNYPLLRRERFTGPMGQTVERIMVADHVVAVLKPSSSDADFKDLLNQHRLSVRGTGPAERSYLIQFDGTDPMRMPQVLDILEGSGLFESIDTDPIELPN